MPAEDALPITVLRPDDLLLLRFHFYGLKLQPPGGGAQHWQLVRNPAGQPTPLIIVEFPPQSIGEESFFESVTFPPPPGQPADPPPDTLRAPPAGALLSGPSWLVFSVANTAPVTYTLGGLIAACVGGQQIVSTRGQRPVDRLHRFEHALKQGNLFTSIEAPFGLILSPEVGSTWTGHIEPAANAAGTRVELWHATMTGNRARAVWSVGLEGSLVPPQGPPPDNTPFRMSLNKADRYELVRLTTDQAPYAAPAEVDQLMLSTLGAWLDAGGKWNPPSALNVTEWKHRMTMGRDHFVRVVYKGFLFPFGHEASLVKITERKIQPVPGAGDGQRAAYLRTRMYIVVRQPVRDFNHNGLPFRQVTLKTLRTPDIDPPEESSLEGLSQQAFWVRSGGNDVLFHVSGKDHENRPVEFSTPLVFVLNSIATGDRAEEVVNKAWANATDPRRRRDLGGQSLAYAHSVKRQDTTLETERISLGARHEPGAGPEQPRFLPLVVEAQVDIPAVKQLLGTNAPCTIVYEDTFTKAGPGQFGNPAEVFARVTGSAPSAHFATEQAGGLVKPDFAINGLSRRLGAVPSAGDMVAGKFSPAAVFGDDIVLLGGVKLSQIVNAVEFAQGAPGDGTLVPRLVTTVENGAAVTRYRWYLKKEEADTETEARGALIGNDLFVPSVGAEFEIVSEIVRPLDGSPGSFLSTGRLTDFKIVLLPDAQLMALNFNAITFTARSGQKLDVSVVFGGIEFLGPLSFVNALMQVVPLDGFADPPGLTIDAGGAGLSYTLAIPSVGIGVFSLQNLSLSAGFYLPFVNSPANVQLGFCTRENPGQVLVSLFGGGVFFGITLDVHGIQAVEMALEFGAGISLNLGVASGSVSVMGGVYYQKSGTQVMLAAYIRMVGKLSVLGLISVCVEFYLALEYQVTADKLSGVATLKVKVKVLFFSKTVGLEVRREFKGSDPTFRDVLALPDWQAYCDAFGD